MSADLGLRTPAEAVIPAEPMTPLPYAVVSAMVEGPDTVTVDVMPTGPGIAAVRPGQFAMVLALGVGEIPISVSGVGPDGRLSLTVRSVGAVSSAIVNLAEGGVVGLRGPYGSAWPVDAVTGGHVAVLAGGLGIAPLRLAIDALVAPESRADRVAVVVGAREPSQVLYRPDVDRWLALGARVVLTVDHATRTWPGSVGTVTAAFQRLGELPDLAFVCGPEAMMLSAGTALVDAGMDPSAVWVSLERNMHCGIAHCGRCQLGPYLLCRDGAVVPFAGVADLMAVRGR
jgi:anaerobic sulfite reductase subunit B